jgi:predicted solute-binding protein
MIITFLIVLKKKVKYAYQELPHSEDTASPHSQEQDKERERGHI